MIVLNDGTLIHSRSSMLTFFRVKPSARKCKKGHKENSNKEVIKNLLYSIGIYSFFFFLWSRFLQIAVKDIINQNELFKTLKYFSL